MTGKDEPRWTMAALVAVLQGDMENAIVAAMPGGIEAQEAQGQRDLIASETLPHEVNSGTREQLEAMGIQYVEQVDDLFWYVRLPDGWKKESTGHSMWSKLLDDKGREWASIFYKAAFYDHRAFVNVKQRYSYGTMPVNGWDDYDGPRRGVVYDGGVVIWQTPKVLERPDPPDHDYWDAQRALENEAGAWLAEHYPDWKNPLAYWD